MKYVRVLTIFLILSLLTGSGLRAASGRKADDAPRRAPQQFTDDDLAKYRTHAAAPAHARPVAAPLAPSADETSVDPLRPFHEREARERMHEQQVRQVRDRMARIEARLDYLRTKRLAILDPMKVMPSAPTEDDQQKDATLRPRALLAAVDEEIASLETDLERAGAKQVVIDARFSADPSAR